MTMRRSLDALSVLSADDLADYDIISDGPRSLESSIADLGAARGCGGEPPPPPAARERFGDVVALSTEDIQTYVQRSLGAGRAGGGGKADEARVWRVYVDGVFGPLTPRCAAFVHLLPYGLRVEGSLLTWNDYYFFPRLLQRGVAAPPSQALLPFRAPSRGRVLR